MSVRTWLERRRADEQVEAEGAARADAQLDRLRKTDPDAGRIFETYGIFTAARSSARRRDELTDQLRRYAALKHEAGRMDLYDQIFTGADA